MKTKANDPINAALDTYIKDGERVMELRYEGLTKREYFAAMAMQGWVSYVGQMDGSNQKTVAAMAKASVVMADELIKELNL